MGHPPKDEVLIIGDSLTSDIKGGNDFGIDTCWYNPRHKPCDQDVEIRHEIQRLHELLAIVGAEWAAGRVSIVVHDDPVGLTRHTRHRVGRYRRHPHHELLGVLEKRVVNSRDRDRGVGGTRQHRERSRA